MPTSLNALNQRRLMASARFHQAMQNADNALSTSFRVQRRCSDLVEKASHMPPTVLLQVKDSSLVVKVFQHAGIAAHKEPSAVL